MSTDPEADSGAPTAVEWHCVGAVDDFEVGSGSELLVAGKVIAIFRTSDSFKATDGMCAHQGGPLSQGFLDGDCVTCPWHGWQYRVSDGCNLLTGKKMLDTYPVETRDGQVWILV
ncbi:MAG: Rieske 2Fe-2S domain-containing protein [Planctomycetota bacterium]